MICRLNQLLLNCTTQFIQSHPQWLQKSMNNYKVGRQLVFPKVLSCVSSYLQLEVASEEPCIPTISYTVISLVASSFICLFVSGGDEMGKEQLDCPVCIQPCVHPVKLPCRHIFCFLCMKGVAMRNRTCALCRHPIPMSFLNNPELVDKTQLTHVPEEVKWFYQGRNHGWWQFEARMEKDLEKR